MRQSVWEYITTLGRWWWVMLANIIPFGVGVYGAYLDISDKGGFPTWLWIGLLMVAMVAFVVVPFRAFHKVRVQRDKALRTEQSLILTPLAWAIGLSGMTGYPKEPKNEVWLHLEVSVNVIDKPIDTLDLIIDSKPIPANQWHGRIVTAFHVYFKVTEWQWKGKNQIELVAHVGGKLHSSGRVTIDFNAEPGGFPRYL